MSNSLSKNRTDNYYLQLSLSALLRVLSIGCSFFAVPITMGYLGIEQYGIWSTLLSILSWFLFFDMGIGNGLRNKLAEALAVKDLASARSYISTAYVIVGFFSFALIFGFCSMSHIIPWQSIFNSSLLTDFDLAKVINIASFFLFLNFWLSLVNQIVNGLQKSSWVFLNQFLANFFSLLLIYGLSKTSFNSMSNLAFVYGISLVASSLAISIYFFSANRDFIPQLSSFTKESARSLLSQGAQFFLIQIACLVILTTDRLLIVQLLGPQHIAGYDVISKLFSIILLGHSMIMSPIWSAYTDAYVKQDFVWIRSAIKKQIKLFVILVLLSALLAFLSEHIIALWVGSVVKLNRLLIFCIFIYVCQSMWSNIFVFFINSTGKLYLSSLICVFAALVNIPVSYILVVWKGFGVEGIVLGTIVSLAAGTIIAPLQCFHILNDSGSRLWHK